MAVDTKSRRRSLVLAMQLVVQAISMQKEAPPASTLSLRTSVSEVSEIIEAASSLYPRALAKRDMHIKQQRAVSVESARMAPKSTPIRRATLGGFSKDSAALNDAQNYFGPSSQLLRELMRRCAASEDGKALVTESEIHFLRDALYGAAHLSAADTVMLSAFLS